jgi:hypothetical protein
LDKDALDFDPLELLPDEAQSGEPVEVLEVRPTALEVCTSEAVINVGDGRSRRPPPPLWPSVIVVDGSMGESRRAHIRPSLHDWRCRKKATWGALISCASCAGRWSRYR